MRNPVLAIILAVVVAIGGIYTAYWFKKSSEFKQALEQSIAQVNENAKTKKDVPTIKYESIDVSGFPFSMQFNVNKPVFDIPVSEISKTAFNKAEAQTATANPTTFNIQAGYDLIALGANVTANSFSLGYSGQTTITPFIDGKAGRAIMIDTTAPVFCHMELHNADYMPWNVPAAFASSDTFFAAFRAVDCQMQGVTSKDTASNATLSTVESMQLVINSAPLDPVNHKLAVLADIKNAQATAEYDNIINYYFQLFYDMAGTPKEQRNTNLNFSQYGVQNSKIDVSYEGPLDKEAFMDPSANIKFDIGALNFKNSIYELLTEVHFSNLSGTNGRSGLANVHWSLTAGEPYEKLMAQQIARAIRQASADPASGGIALQLAAYGTPDDIATALVPRFHNLGKISVDTDIKMQGEPGKDTLKEGTLTINQFDILNHWYGVKLKGNGKATKAAMPSGDITATCVLCDTLVDGLAGYATDIDSILRKSRPGQVPYVTAQLVAGIKQFLHAIDEPAAGKAQGSVQVHVVAAENGMTTVSGKQLPEVFGLFSQYIAPYLPQAQAAAQPQARIPAAPAKVAPKK